MSRFARTRMLFGEAGFARLAKARVTVVGLGAVGSYAVEGLARVGIGRLRIVDFDVVRDSNINRQLLALTSTLGLSKAAVAERRILEINPDCVVEPCAVFVDRQTAADVLEPAPDVLIDAIDSVGPKVALLEAAARRGLRVVSSMGAASRTDPLAVRVADLAETRGCPLARLVRKRLGAVGIRTGIRCVYSTEPVAAPRGAACDPGNEPEAVGRGRPRLPLGSFSCLTGVFGLVAAREAIMAILGDAR